jgi:hypothetical protein
LEHKLLGVAGKDQSLQGRLSLSEWMKRTGIMHSYQLLNNVENFAHSNGHLITSGALWDSEKTETSEKKFKLNVLKIQELRRHRKLIRKLKMPQEG